jgi:hypothetical protein
MAFNPYTHSTKTTTLNSIIVKDLAAKKRAAKLKSAIEADARASKIPYLDSLRSSFKPKQPN